MSKSVGNIRSLRGALEARGRDALIMYFVGGHYRGPLAFSEEALEEAARAVERVRDLIRRLDPEGPAPEGMDAYVERFFDALADDFNTAEARSVLFEWVSEANRRIDAGESVGFRRCCTPSASRTCWPRTRSPRRRRPSSSCATARRPARRATSPRPTRSGTSSRRSAGRSATPPRGRG